MFRRLDSCGLSGVLRFRFASNLCPATYPARDFSALLVRSVMSSESFARKLSFTSSSVQILKRSSVAFIKDSMSTGSAANSNQRESSFPRLGDNPVRQKRHVWALRRTLFLHDVQLRNSVSENPCSQKRHSIAYSGTSLRHAGHLFVWSAISPAFPGRN